MTWIDIPVFGWSPARIAPAAGQEGTPVPGSGAMGAPAEPK
jgi:hypothetical protein